MRRPSLRWVSTRCIPAEGWGRNKPPCSNGPNPDHRPPSGIRLPHRTIAINGGSPLPTSWDGCAWYAFHTRASRSLRRIRRSAATGTQRRSGSSWKSAGQTPHALPCLRFAGNVKTGYPGAGGWNGWTRLSWSCDPESGKLSLRQLSQKPGEQAETGCRDEHLLVISCHIVRLSGPCDVGIRWHGDCDVVGTHAVIVSILHELAGKHTRKSAGEMTVGGDHIGGGTASFTHDEIVACEIERASDAEPAVCGPSSLVREFPPPLRLALAADTAVAPLNEQSPFKAWVPMPFLVNSRLAAPLRMIPSQTADRLMPPIVSVGSPLETLGLRSAAASPAPGSAAPRKTPPMAYSALAAPQGEKAGHSPRDPFAKMDTNGDGNMFLEEFTVGMK